MYPSTPDKYYIAWTIGGVMWNGSTRVVRLLLSHIRCPAAAAAAAADRAALVTTYMVRVAPTNQGLGASKHGRRLSNQPEA